MAEIEGYQRIIDGARQVVENWRPNIELELEEERKAAGIDAWETKSLEDVAVLEYGFTASAEERGDARFVRITDISDDGTLYPNESKFITLDNESKKYLLTTGDLLVARTGATYGKTLLVDLDQTSVFASYLIRIRFPKKEVLPKYYWYFSRSENYWIQAKRLVTGGGQPQFNGNVLKNIVIAIPPIEIQDAIVARIDTEREVVEANRRLIQVYEGRIKKVIERVWEG